MSKMEEKFLKLLKSQSDSRTLFTSFSQVHYERFDAERIKKFHDLVNISDTHLSNATFKTTLFQDVRQIRQRQVQSDEKRSRDRYSKLEKKEKDVNKRCLFVVGFYVYFLNALLKFSKIKYFRDVPLISLENWLPATILFVLVTALCSIYYCCLASYLKASTTKKMPSALNAFNCPYKMRALIHSQRLLNEQKWIQRCKITQLNYKDLNLLEINVSFLNQDQIERNLKDFLMIQINNGRQGVEQQERNLDEENLADFERRKEFIDYTSIIIGTYLSSIVEILVFFKPQVNSLNGQMLPIQKFDIFSGVVIGVFSTATILVVFCTKILPYRIRRK